MNDHLAISQSELWILYVQWLQEILVSAIEPIVELSSELSEELAHNKKVQKLAETAITSKSFIEREIDDLLTRAAQLEKLENLSTSH